MQGLQGNSKGSDIDEEPNAEDEQLSETDDRLRQELLETHLSLIAVVGASQELKTNVLNLLIEAGKHLGEPETNSRRVYDFEYFLNWNDEGLDLVAQAKALLFAKPVVATPVSSVYNESPGYLYNAIGANDKESIEESLVGNSEVVGFVFWHSHTHPLFDSGWTKDYADKCTTMGFKTRPVTIDNPDLTGHVDENYKTIVYISH
jgi:hypothetical protein